MPSIRKYNFGPKNYSGETQKYSNSLNSCETFLGDCCKLRTKNGGTSLVNYTAAPARRWPHWG